MLVCFFVSIYRLHRKKTTKTKAWLSFQGNRRSSVVKSDQVRRVVQET